jgi:excinuclease ABC subunit B
LYYLLGGDLSRKKTLIEFGFRLPSAADNRPLTFSEFEERVGSTIYTSATPGVYEAEHSTQVVEQVIRPTGLIDPEIILKPVTGKAGYEGQVADFIAESERVVKGGGRVLVTTLTKKMAEDLSEFLKERKVKAEYIHSDVKTIDRITILTQFRKGDFDCIVGVNLLREGLDLPEVELVGILDADKEGFLRSETSLIQTIGRAARNVKGRVILYADEMTGSMTHAIEETNRRRGIQLAYNKEHGITPKTIQKNIKDITETLQAERERAVGLLMAVDTERANDPKELKKLIAERREAMEEAVKLLDFETAALIRDEVYKLEEKLPPPPKKPRKPGRVYLDE